MDALSQTFSALADPTRRAILTRLCQGEAYVGELAKPFDVSLPAISRHLKVLERAGLIERGREAQWRPCRLEAKRLQEIDAWLGPYRRFWEESFDRLETYLAALQNKPDPQPKTSREPVEASAKPQSGRASLRARKSIKPKKKRS